MKKSSFLFLIFLLFILTACGNTENAGDTNENSSERQTEENENTKSKLEIINSTGSAWVNSIGTVWVHSSAVFENTGTVPVDIGETQMNFKAQDDSILGTASMIYAVPSVVLPGETAYITESTILDGVSNAADYKETTYNFGFNETNEDPNLLEVSGVKGVKGDSYTPYKVTGVVKNVTKELQDDIRLAAGLFDAEGQLLGVLSGSVDVGVNPGSEAGFELTYPELPKGVADKVATVDVKAYGWTW